jgi:hypothetical protein
MSVSYAHPGPLRTLFGFLRNRYQKSSMMAKSTHETRMQLAIAELDTMEMTRPFSMILGYSIALCFLCPLCSGMDLSQE